MISIRFASCLAALLLATPLLSACGSSSAPPPASATRRTVSAPYVIGPGDQLSVFVYQSPQLSVPSLPVRPDGRISIPLVPEIVAAGKTPTQLGDELASQLKKYVRDPIVTVMVQGFVGPLDQQVRVIGEATEPLAIPYRDGLTVLDVMIQTKGLTRYAAGNSAVIVRKAGGGQDQIRVRLSDLIRDGDIRQNVYMQPGDTLIIPQTWF